jgi:hypothetical protein
MNSGDFSTVKTIARRFSILNGDPAFAEHPVRDYNSRRLNSLQWRQHETQDQSIDARVLFVLGRLFRSQ